jgi:hypothetical protein
MKKSLLILLLFSTVGTTFAQTILNQFPIKLQKSSDYFQLFNAENTQKDYFVFIADKEKVTVLKYNSALFFKDSLSVSRPNRSLEFMVGVTFTKDGEPNLYWSSKNYETSNIVNFDFENRVISDLIYTNDFLRHKIIDSFVANNTLNIVSVTPENTLKFTNFSNNGKNDYNVSINPEQSSNLKPDADLVVNAILDKGIAVIQTNQYTPLFVTTAKVKRYLQNESYIVSFDSAFSTTLFTVNLQDYSSKKELYSYEKLNKDAGSNSFLHQDILYQLTANSESISLVGIDLKTKNTLGKYQATSKQEIDFKNSPLYMQTENRKARVFRNTSKFLSNIDLQNLGLSVYSSPNYNLFTIGGIKEVPSSGGLALAIGMGVGGLMSGSDVMVGSDLMNTNTQNIYFESLFDENFKHIKPAFQPLYIDQMGNFLNDNRIAVQNIFPYKNYVILNYYDSKTNEFVMRKFEDSAE